jgi:hypothetical protein
MEDAEGASNARPDEKNWAIPRESTLDGFAGEVSACEGVSLPDLDSMTTLFVRTCHSVYRIIVLRGTTVLVQGGPFFPDVTTGQLVGSGFGGKMLKLGWIGVGLRLEISADGRRFVTSPVRAITTEGPLDPESRPCRPTRHT